jgi:hypothetical protein
MFDSLNSPRPLNLNLLSFGTRFHIATSDTTIPRTLALIATFIRLCQVAMCFYHAYSHQCGHTEMVLQQLCGKGQMKQQKCARGQDGTILATVKVETPCAVCPKKA